MSCQLSYSSLISVLSKNQLKTWFSFNFHFKNAVNHSAWLMTQANNKGLKLKGFLHGLRLACIQFTEWIKNQFLE